MRVSFTFNWKSSAPTFASSTMLLSASPPTIPATNDNDNDDDDDNDNDNDNDDDNDDDNDNDNDNDTGG